MNKLNTLKKTSLFQQAVDSLLNYILVNDLQEGDKLPPENQLKDIFGISRNTLREALKSLQLLGIIDTKQNVGIVVQDFSISDITKFVPLSLRVEDAKLKSLLEAREWIEQSVLPAIVERRTDEDLLKLNDIVDDIDRYIEQEQDFYELDFQFHQALVECCHNPFMINVNMIFKEFFTLYMRETYNREYNNLSDHYPKKIGSVTNAEHKIIYKCVEERNLRLLQKMHKKHLYALAISVAPEEAPE